MNFNLRSLYLILIFFFLGLGIIGCSESTEPLADNPARSGAQGQGTIDPAAGSFILKTFDVPPPHGGSAIPVQLVGSNLVVLPDSGQVSLDVALRNLHFEPLFAPAMIWLSEITPSSVLVLNPDQVRAPMGPDAACPTCETQFGFDYSDLFGEDDVLGPDETSDAKTWIFSNADNSSFSFAAQAEFGMVPDLPRIAGLCWSDQNRNGIFDQNELPLGFGMVEVRLPHGGLIQTMVQPDGRFALPVEESGLYQLHFHPMVETILPVGFSTPNPLEILLVPGPNRQPNSFLEANFGIFNEVPGFGIIQFTNLPADSLQVGDYRLLEAYLESPVSLGVTVNYGGCGPDEPFTLFMTGGFLESMPPQANIVLRKDYETDCDAIWQTQIHFDLGPLVDRFLDAYGPGILLLNLIDFAGNERQLELVMFPPD